MCFYTVFCLKSDCGNAPIKAHSIVAPFWPWSFSILGAMLQTKVKGQGMFSVD